MNFGDKSLFSLISRWSQHISLIPVLKQKHLSYLHCRNFWHYPLKSSKASHKTHLSPLLAQKVLHPQDIVDAAIFCAKMGFCVKCFFLYIRNEKEMGCPMGNVLFFTYICFVFHPKKLYPWSGTQGLFSWKIVNNWTMSRSSFCRYIFPEEWSNNNNVFFRSAIEGLCNVIFMFLVNT